MGVSLGEQITLLTASYFRDEGVIVYSDKTSFLNCVQAKKVSELIGTTTNLISCWVLLQRSVTTREVSPREFR